MRSHRSQCSKHTVVITESSSRFTTARGVFPRVSSHVVMLSLTFLYTVIVVVCCLEWFAIDQARQFYKTGFS